MISLNWSDPEEIKKEYGQANNYKTLNMAMAEKE